MSSFFIEHKKDKNYPSGGFAGRIKKGFAEQKDETPKYAIKIFRKDKFGGNTIHELRLAMRAAYYYKKLGREGYSFRKNFKQYLVTNWLQGATLDRADQTAVQSMPIPRRIVMAISLLRELNILHNLGFVHNDIKPSNVIVNYGNLNFVDLDSVRPVNEVPHSGGTPMFSTQFLPSAQMAFDAAYNPSGLFMKFDSKTDLYAMGLTLSMLFSEIYKLKSVVNKINVNGGHIDTFNYETFQLWHGEDYEKHSELQKIIKQMVFLEKDKIQTVDEFIAALEKVLTTYPDYKKYLDEDTLKQTQKEIIPKEGIKAFDEIEMELHGFNLRANAVCGKPFK